MIQSLMQIFREVLHPLLTLGLIARIILKAKKPVTKVFISPPTDKKIPEAQQQPTMKKLTTIFAAAALAISAAFSKLENELKPKIAVLLTFAEQVLNLLNKKVVIDIIGIISPAMRQEIPQIDKILADAILALTATENVVSVVKDPAQSDADFLKTVFDSIVTELQSTNVFARNAFMVKLMSICLSTIEPGQKEHVYDTIIQSAVATSKQPQ